MEDAPAAGSSERPRPAPHSLRLLAWSIDLGLILLVVVWVPHASLALLLGFFIAYHTLLTWLTQRTAGKALLGLRVERVTGRKPSFSWALGRASLGYFIVDVLGVGVVVALFNHQHRCPHDYCFGSVVSRTASRLKSPATLEDRLQEYEEQVKSARAERFKTLGALAGLLEFLRNVAAKIQAAITSIEHWLGFTTAGPADTSLGAALSLKATATLLVATTAMTGVALVAVPPLRHAVDDLFRPLSWDPGPAPRPAPAPPTPPPPAPPPPEPRPPLDATVARQPGQYENTSVIELAPSKFQTTTTGQCFRQQDFKDMRVFEPPLVPQCKTTDLKREPARFFWSYTCANGSSGTWDFNWSSTTLDEMITSSLPANDRSPAWTSHWHIKAKRIGDC